MPPAAPDVDVGADAPALRRAPGARLDLLAVAVAAGLVAVALAVGQYLNRPESDVVMRGDVYG